jgi:hypothetical protein
VGKSNSSASADKLFHREKTKRWEKYKVNTENTAAFTLCVLFVFLDPSVNSVKKKFIIKIDN